jgi:hypothetical protein
MQIRKLHLLLVNWLLIVIAIAVVIATDEMPVHLWGPAMLRCSDQLIYDAITGDRLKFCRTLTGPWQLFNHSTERHPAVYAETSGTLYLFASGATGDRLEFYRTPTGPWQPPSTTGPPRRRHGRSLAVYVDTSGGRLPAGQ